MKHLSSSIATFLFFALPLHAQLSQDEFRKPPLQARPSALWSWMNGHVDHAQITRELEEMKAKGMRGAIIWDIGSLRDPDKIIPVGPEFLGPESLKSIHHAMDEAERLGLELGLVASSSWNAGGSWITPKHGSKAIISSELRVDGPGEFSGTLPLPDKTTEHHENVAVLAVPDGADKTVGSIEVPIRLDSMIAVDGKLTWQVPAGSWRILRFVRNNTGQLLTCPSPKSKGLMIDHLSREATDAHMLHILDRLKHGRDGYGPLKMLMLDSYEVWPANDWTPDFIKQFTQYNGYDPTPWLPVLAGWTVGDKDLSARFEHDYRKTVGALMIDNHYARSRELLNERGLKLLVEAGHGGYPRVDPLKALGGADIPMGEFWNGSQFWVTKEAASAASIYGGKIVAAESFTGWRHWQDGPATYKRLFDIALCAGLNQVVFHTFSHNPPESGLPGFAYHAGEHFNVNITWWNQAGPMLEDMSRACHLLQQGRLVADVCMYYGDNAPNLVPARRITPQIKPVHADHLCGHCGLPQPVDHRTLGQGYDYDFINEDIILNRMTVQDGKLMLPHGMSYRMMVLPDRESISPAVLKKLGDLIEAGATIVGRKPLRSNSLVGHPGCDEDVRDLANRIWGDCDGDKVKSHNFGKGRVLWNVPLNEALTNMGVERDFVPEGIDNSDRKIDYIHRETEKEDIYFVSNSALERQTVRCRFRVASGRVPSFWNAENGSVKPSYAYESKGGFTSITLDLAPASSIFVVFAEGKARDSIVEIKQPAGDSIELLAWENGKLTAKAWQNGNYQFKTASGRSATVEVSGIPAEQLIAGPWKLTFPENRGAPESATMDTLTDWTNHPEPGVKHFSGGATYQNQFTLAQVPADGIVLDLGAVKEVAVVRVNGKDAGVLWKEPYHIDIAPMVKAGDNRLEITVVNSWSNRIVGDHGLDPAKRVTRTNVTNRFNENTPLLPSGLLGPVKLRFAKAATCEL